MTYEELTRHPLADLLDTLDRDELLQFIHDHLRRLQVWPRASQFLSPTERDVLGARWQVACRRATVAREKANATFADLRPLAEAVDEARNAWTGAAREGPLNNAVKRMRKYDRAHDAYVAADAVRRKLEARADRLQLRADRLWEEWESMRGDAS